MYDELSNQLLYQYHARTVALVYTRPKIHRWHSGTRVFYFYINVGVKQRTNQTFHGCHLITLFTKHFSDLQEKAIATVIPADTSISEDQGKLSSQAKKKILFSSIIQFTLESLEDGESIIFNSFYFFCCFFFLSISINSTLFCSIYSAQLELHEYL